MRKHSIFLCFLQVLLFESFEFAFYNNDLYASIPNQVWDRGYQTLWGLLQLKIYVDRKNLTLSNFIGHIDNINNDVHSWRDLAFWRTKNDQNIVLWPEHDYWGWQGTWQAPYPIYISALQNNHISWGQKLNAVYWSGSVFIQDNQDIRSKYSKCSKFSQFQDKIIVDTIDWRLDTQSGSKSLFSENDTKPIYLDGRKRLHYKFLIYLWGLQWSSVLKRLLATKSLLIMPDPNPHESYVSYLLEKHCPDCYLRVRWSTDQSSIDFCNDLNKIIESVSSSIVDNSYKRMSERLFEFAMKYLSYDETITYMYETIQRLSSNHSTKSKRNFKNINDHIHKRIISGKLTHFNCESLKRYHFYEKMHSMDNRPAKIKRLKWQYAEWYDEECYMRSNVSYLAFTAI